jgi:glycine/D-amino acid oxidase-like deaminating enzyme
MPTSARGDIFHPDFVPEPFWWEAYRPVSGDLAEVPGEARVAIVGGGYAGLAAALELARHGIDAVVLERGALGIGASTRNGGSVSGGVNIGKSFSGRAAPADAERSHRLLSDASDAFALIERLIEDEAIECFWQKRGRFVGAWTPTHYDYQEKRLASLNDDAASGAYMVPRERQREEIASDYYYGGMVVERSASLHPALYYKGLLDACRRRGVTVCAEASVEKISANGANGQGGWRVETSRGTLIAGDVVIATNGYTGPVTPALRRRIVPIASHIIATEKLPPDLAGGLIPKRRSISDTKRVLCYYRLSPDGSRMVFGGRARFTPADPLLCARVLYEYMTERFPQLKGAKVTHSWTGNTAFTLDALPHMGEEGGLHYCLGCNGSGVAMMTYLGTQTARKIARVANAPCAFDAPEFPDHPLYSGNPWFLPLVGGWYRMRDRVDRLLA